MLMAAFFRIRHSRARSDDEIVVVLMEQKKYIFLRSLLSPKGRQCMDSKPVQLSNSADTPVTPPEIIEAATAGRLILFVGAGVSRLAGGPSWADAADIAFKELVDKGLLPFAEAEQLRTEHPKKRLSIAMDISEEASLKMNFERIFCPPEEQIDAQIYRDLYSLGVPIVTTHYDAGLDRQAEMELPLSGTVQPRHLRMCAVMVVEKQGGLF